MLPLSDELAAGLGPRSELCRQTRRQLVANVAMGQICEKIPMLAGIGVEVEEFAPFGPQGIQRQPPIVGEDRVVVAIRRYLRVVLQELGVAPILVVAFQQRFGTSDRPVRGQRSPGRPNPGASA